MRRVWVTLLLAALAATALPVRSEDAIATEKATTSPPPVAVPQQSNDNEIKATMVREDPSFDPYDGDKAAVDAKYQPTQRKVELFDFDPSEGLTFHVYSGKQECFFENVKSTGDEISGAYVVASADSHIDLEIKNPEGIVIYRRFGDAEGQYQVRPTEEGVHELCFINSDSDGKLVTHVTNSLQSQHPVEREHVSVLAKYASHLDVRLGELESEQRLQQIRTDRFIKIEESTSQRVAFYGTLECFVYFLICLYQVLYIKGLIDGPRPARSKQWA